MKSNFSFLAIVLMFTLGSIVSCKSDKGKYQGLDLMKYGIPYIVNAPINVVTSQIGGGQMLDLRLTNDEDYDVMIFMTKAETKRLNIIKQFKKEEVSFYPGFKKIIEEYNEGFIYEKYSPNGNISYDFYAIKIVGDNEINFISGAKRDYSEAEVKAMIRTILY